MRIIRILSTAALTTVAAIAMGVMSATATPIATRAAQLEKATSGQVVEVQWRRWRRAAPWIAGGLVAGAIIASQRPYYYGPGYVYDVPPPGAHALPRGPGPRMCWVPTTPDSIHGYWAAC